MKNTWLKAWIAQFALMLALCFLAEISYYASGILHSVFAWALIPMAGAYTACRAVLKGLNNYLAWIAPPTCMVIASVALWSYVPHAGPVLVCAFVSLVGAAAGEVLSKEKNSKRH